MVNVCIHWNLAQLLSTNQPTVSTQTTRFKCKWELLCHVPLYGFGKIETNRSLSRNNLATFAVACGLLRVDDEGRFQ